jgi:alpha-L-arabinofuranosidase
MRTMSRAVVTFCPAVALASLLPLGVVAQNAPKPLVVLHADTVVGSVSPLIFGASERWPDGAGSSVDPNTGMTNALTLEQIKDVGISLIRYPAGALGDLFQWQRAVGPQARRGQQVSGTASDSAPLDSRFGPDEFGDLLDKTGAVGYLTINFGTASAADAANFVAYMSAPIGSALANGVDWAARRAANRHPPPYKIAYVAIGDQGEPAVRASADQNDWIMGAPTSINATCASDQIACLYAFGGSTRFEHQPVVQVADWRALSSVSSGEPRQTMYARYAPVAAGSETVWVDGAPWQGLSDLAAAAPDAKVYQINYPAGAISFGDGVHGAIPPKGGTVTVSYTSGPHQGFVDFYRSIKAVNPSVKVCASIHDESLIRILGAQHLYDCIELQPKGVGDTKVNAPSKGPDDVFVRLASQAVQLGDEVERTRQLVKKYAGANAPKVEMVLSHYGPLDTVPAFSHHFARTEGQAVLQALCLREWVLTGVSAAARAFLTADTFKPSPATGATGQFSIAPSAEDFALFAGPGPDTIVTPAALATKLLRRHSGSTLIASGIEASPKLNVAAENVIDALQGYATRDALGNAYLVVINVDPQHDIEATVRVDGSSFGTMATVATLSSREMFDENSPQDPLLISIKETSADFGGGTLDLSFPKHSATGITLTAAK